jgi:hypothetical protein
MDNDTADFKNTSDEADLDEDDQEIRILEDPEEIEKHSKEWAEELHPSFHKREIVQPTNSNGNASLEIPQLDNVYAVFDKWMQISDRKRIDVILAVALSHHIKGIPIWLIVIAPSGDGKNELLLALENRPDVYHIKSLNANALCSGQINKREIDLAKKLDGKIMLIPEMAQLLTMSWEQKAMIWSQFKNLYDGYAGKETGGGTNPKYSGLRVSFLGGSTPKIDSQIIIHNELGTRELEWRSDGEDDGGNKVKLKVYENEGEEIQMRREISGIVDMYLRHRIEKIKEIQVSDEIRNKIFDYTDYLAMMRCPAEIDTPSGELINFVSPERPTRSLKQLKKLYVSLKNLDDNYSDERALEIIKKVVKSSGVTIRQRIYSLLIEDEEDFTKFDRNNFTTKQIAEILRMNWKTVYRELNTLHALDLLNRKDPNPDYEGFGKEKRLVWTVNPDKIIRI